MTQYARPDSDVSVGGWTTADLYAKIDETPYSDADEIQAQVRASNQTCEVGLSDVTDPTSSSAHVIKIRAKFSTNNSRTATLDVLLIEGTTTRATFNTGTLTTGYAEYSYTLSGAEADAISDYTNLRLRFVGKMNAGGSGTSCITFVSWAEVGVPDATVNGSVLAVAATASAAAGTPTVAGSGGGTDGSVTGVVATANAAGLAPLVSGECILGPPVATASAAGSAPTVAGAAAVVGVVGAASAAGIPPAVAASGAAVITAVTATASAVGVAPALTAEAAVTGVAGAADAAAPEPAVTAESGGNVTAVAALATATAATSAPDVGGAGGVAGVAAVGAAGALAPTVAARIVSVGGLAVVCGTLGGRGFAAGVSAGRFMRARLAQAAGAGTDGRELSGAAGAGMDGRELAGSPETGSW